MLKKIDELKQRANPPADAKPKISNKNKMENVIKNAEDIYELRNKIVKLKKQKKEKLKMMNNLKLMNKLILTGHR